MFSLLVTAQLGAWNQRAYEYARDRFCEHTTQDLVDKFASLSAEAVSELKSMPCLFAYEGQHELRLGHLTAVRARQGGIVLTHKFDENVPPIPFEKFKPLQILLDVDDWEFSRTHWSIKDIDLLSVLAEEGLTPSHTMSISATSIPPESSWDLLGRGGFGSVYRMHEPRLEVDFAIKVFTPSPFFTSTEKARQRFMREAGLLFKLDHPHVVRIYDAGELADGRPFIKMEYFEGSDLQKAVTDQPFTEGEILHATRQLAEAIAHAHERGITHRDIKPTNALISPSRDHVKLIDFGLGILVEEAVARARLTSSSEQFGSAFSAPELLQYAHSNHAELDVYSLGAVWFWMYTRRSPQGTGIDESIAELGIDVELRTLLRQCLLPLHRRPSAAQALTTLTTILQPKRSSALLARSEASAKVEIPGSAYLDAEDDIRSTLGLDAEWAVSSEWVSWARSQLTAPPGRYGAAGRVVRLVATWTDTYNREWISEDSAVAICTVVLGLDDNEGSPAADLASTVRDAFDRAVRMGWLGQDEYDDWRPGMRPGSGIRHRYKLTPLGKKVLRESGYVPKPPEATATRRNGL